MRDSKLLMFHAVIYQKMHIKKSEFKNLTQWQNLINPHFILKLRMVYQLSSIIKSIL